MRYHLRDKFLNYYDGGLILKFAKMVLFFANKLFKCTSVIHPLSLLHLTLLEKNSLFLMTGFFPVAKSMVKLCLPEF